MRTSILYVLFISLFLTGCMAMIFGTADQLNKLSVGMKKDEVIRLLGQPKSVSAVGNTEYLKYRWVKTVIAADGNFPEDYYVTLLNGKVLNYGRAGDFDSSHDYGTQLEADSELQSCFQKVKNNPQLNVISTKLALESVSEQTFVMLTNTNKPNDAEKTAISLFADLRKECFKTYDKTQVSTPLAIKSVDNSARSAIENLLVMLYNDKLTYGEFAKARQEIVNALNSAIVEIDKELRTNAANANARAEQIAIQRTAAIAAMQNANAAIQNAITNQNAVEALKNQAPTIQFQSPKGIHCTSQKFGGSVTTDCQ